MCITCHLFHHLVSFHCRCLTHTHIHRYEGVVVLFLHLSPHIRSLLCSPVALVSLQDLTVHAHTLIHMVLITTRDEWREWASEGNSKKERKNTHTGSFLPVSFTTEPWLFSQESVPPVAQQPGNNGMRDRDRWGWSYPPFLSLSLCLWLLLVRSKREREGTFKFSPRPRDHFFPPPLAEYGEWSKGAEGCVRAQMGSILIMERVLLWETEGEEGPRCVSVYIRVELKLQRAWSSHGPGSSRPTLPCYCTSHWDHLFKQDNQGFEISKAALQPMDLHSPFATIHFGHSLWSAMQNTTSLYFQREEAQDWEIAIGWILLDFVFFAPGQLISTCLNLCTCFCVALHCLGMTWHCTGCFPQVRPVSSVTGTRCAAVLVRVCGCSCACTPLWFA